MVAKKRSRTESSPTSEFYLERKAKPRTPGTVRIFSLDPGLQNSEDSISSIFPIVPRFGWSLKKEAFKIDSSKEVCHHFVLSKEVVGTSQLADSVIGSSLKVIGPGTITRADCLRFVFSLSKGNDTFTLPPVVSISLKLVTGSGYKCGVEFNLSPGVGLTSNTTETWLWNANIDQYFVYHGAVDKTNPKWTQELSEFLWCGDGGKVPSVRIKGAKMLSVIRNGFELDSKTVLTPFTLIDKDSKRHPCHKEVLADQCPYFHKALEENPSMTEINLGIKTCCIELLLHHLYHPQKPFPPIPNFEVAIELLRLALRLELGTLLAIAFINLSQKLSLATSPQLRGLYTMYSSVTCPQLKFQVQIIFNLWKALVIKIRSRILEEDDGKTTCFDQVGSLLNLSAFTRDGYFRYELLEDLSRDLNRWEGETGEDTAQQLKVQRLINRFELEVIKRMGTKLVANKIQL